MIKWFWGPPSNPGMLRFHISTLLSKPNGEPRSGQKYFVNHEITGLYGVQVGKTFVGRIAFGQWGNEYGPREPWAGQRAECEGRDDPEERCPRHPNDCVCWEDKEARDGR